MTWPIIAALALGALLVIGVGFLVFYKRETYHSFDHWGQGITELTRQVTHSLHALENDSDDIHHALRDMVEQQNKMIETNTAALNDQLERLQGIDNGQASLGDSVVHHLAAIAEALDDKKVRVLNVPGYPQALQSPQSPQYNPQSAPQTPVSASDPRLQSLFGTVQALGKAKRAAEEELIAIREAVAAEKDRLGQLSSIGVTHDRRETDPKTTDIGHIDEAPGGLGDSKGGWTAFDDIMKRVQANEEQK